MCIPMGLCQICLIQTLNFNSELRLVLRASFVCISMIDASAWAAYARKNVSLAPIQHNPRLKFVM